MKTIFALIAVLALAATGCQTNGGGTTSTTETQPFSSSPGPSPAWPPPAPDTMDHPAPTPP
jgi:hypothetical protein